ncbi:hypothetical protein JOM56_011839 [Amanita muscaria]
MYIAIAHFQRHRIAGGVSTSFAWYSVFAASGYTRSPALALAAELHAVAHGSTLFVESALSLVSLWVNAGWTRNNELAIHLVSSFPQVEHHPPESNASEPA